MKKGLLRSYIDGFTNLQQGESYSALMRYFLPELVSAFVLYSALNLIDAKFVADLRSTSTYATLGVTKFILHFIIKAAEGIAVSATVLFGYFNGLGEYKKLGQTFADVFWTSLFVGLAISSILYFGAYWIYYFYGVPPKMIRLGIPFLRLRAIGIFFAFVSFSFLSFLRSVKNTKTPMIIYLIGAVFFIFFDYALIFGKFGFPAMGLQGSACAYVIQHMVMVLLGIFVLFFQNTYKQYRLTLIPAFSVQTIKHLLVLSWPIVLDKSIMAITYLWLGRMIAPMGKYIIASYNMIADMERLSFLPAIAFAQIITFLASNDFGAKRYDVIKTNIKKCIFLSSIAVLFIIILFSTFPEFFISFFDPKGAFTAFCAFVFPIVSILIFADVVQIILAGALRGIGQVQLVMWARFFCCFGIFFPVSFFLSNLPMQSQALKFILIYGMFYVCNIFMSIIYIQKFRSAYWLDSPDTSKDELDIVKTVPSTSSKL